MPTSEEIIEPSTQLDQTANPGLSQYAADLWSQSSDKSTNISSTTSGAESALPDISISQDLGRTETNINSTGSDSRRPSPWSQTTLPESTYPSMDSSTVPGTDSSTLPGLDSSTMPGTDSSTLPGTDNSTLPGTDSSTLPGTDNSTLPGTDSSTLPGLDGSTMPGTDSSTLPGTDSSTLPGLDGSTMPGTDNSTLPGLDGSTMPGTDNSTLPGLDGSTMPGTDSNTMPDGSNTYPDTYPSMDSSNVPPPLPEQNPEEAQENKSGPLSYIKDHPIQTALGVGTALFLGRGKIAKLLGKAGGGNEGGIFSKLKTELPKFGDAGKQDFLPGLEKVAKTAPEASAIKEAGAMSPLQEKFRKAFPGWYKI